jgi:AraC family transcriptional regulator
MNPPAASERTTIGQLSTRPDGWRRIEWIGGSFETAHRPHTTLVEGVLKSDRHLVMATLRGGAERHETRADDGHRYDGPDRPGSISFLPAGCERRLRLHNVNWRWAAIGLSPEAGVELSGVGPVSALDDGMVLGLLSEFERLDAIDGGLDPAYCETMALALSRYLGRRYGGVKPAADRAITLPAWRLRRISEHIDARLAHVIRIADLARCAGLSEGHFHRAFRSATGKTPLAFIQQRRVDVAAQLLAQKTNSVSDIALQVGFVSPTHFARVFHAIIGCNPAEFRRRHSID